MIETSNYLDPATARALKDARRMTQEVKKTLNDITDANASNITDNSEGVFDIAEVSGENSDGLYDLAEVIAALDERISILEDKLQ